MKKFPNPCISMNITFTPDKLIVEMTAIVTPGIWYIPFNGKKKFFLMFVVKRNKQSFFNLYNFQVEEDKVEEVCLLTKPEKKI